MNLDHTDMNAMIKAIADAMGGKQIGKAAFTDKDGEFDGPNIFKADGTRAIVGGEDTQGMFRFDFDTDDKADSFLKAIQDLVTGAKTDGDDTNLVVETVSAISAAGISSLDAQNDLLVVTAETLGGNVVREGSFTASDRDGDGDLDFRGANILKATEQPDGDVQAAVGGRDTSGVFQVEFDDLTTAQAFIEAATAIAAPQEFG